MNMHGVFLHVLGDALGSVGAICKRKKKLSNAKLICALALCAVTGVIVYFVEDDWKYYADPILSLLLALIIFRTR